MRSGFWLLIVVGKASLITTAGALAIVVPAFKTPLTNGEEALLGAAAWLLPTGIVVWWMLRALQSYCTRREARAVGGAFAFSIPVSVVLGTLSGAAAGGHLAQILGYPGGLVAGVAGLVAMSALVSLTFCLPALWIARYEAKLESAHYPSTAFPS